MEKREQIIDLLNKCIIGESVANTADRILALFDIENKPQLTLVCPHCNGTGKLYASTLHLNSDDNKCGFCNGTGNMEHLFVTTNVENLQEISFCMCQDSTWHYDAGCFVCDNCGRKARP